MIKCIKDPKSTLWQIRIVWCAKENE